MEPQKREKDYNLSFINLKYTINFAGAVRVKYKYLQIIWCLKSFKKIVLNLTTTIEVYKILKYLFCSLSRSVANLK